MHHLKCLSFVSPGLSSQQTGLSGNLSSSAILVKLWAWASAFSAVGSRRKVPLLVTKVGLWLSHFAFNYPSITQSLSLSFSKMFIDLGNSCPVPLHLWIPFAPFLKLLIPCNTQGFSCLGIPSQLSPGESLPTFTATLCQGLSVLHPAAGMPSSLPARQQVIWLQNPISAPAFSDHSLDKLSHFGGLQKRTQREMSTQALILGISGLPPDSGYISQENISCPKIFIHSSSNPI